MEQTTSHLNEPLGLVTVTHPFHPLSGQQLPWLKRRVLNGVPFVQLRLGDNSVSLPEEWTDATGPACPSDDTARAIVSPRALAELIDLVARMEAD